ncbi:hypothetical protein [Cohaesibacter celericrescens]|uniref:Uncharacterized protein n=1 Tax=Cohaesibacter celericrescens TaxID=2067669 RepID=A0A2N5XNL7_9HYPH|nr:hypothetical protein [Cohaesibacter celericrescens]PLW76018.1 hypothetical protein C0081_17040 [Cohaesibacter celericrescens]
MHAIFGVVSSFFTFATIAPAAADSCWWHNGSLMRLQAQGNQRWFSYERPRAGLSVGRGTLLFNGRKSGNWYSGTARVFSKYCPDTPLEYHVEGPVQADQLGVTMHGDREVHKRCRGTGRWTRDTLVFTYAKKC